MGSPGKGKEGGEWESRGEEGGDGVPECPNSELASLFRLGGTAGFLLELHLCLVANFRKCHLINAEVIVKTKTK